MLLLTSMFVTSGRLAVVLTTTLVVDGRAPSLTSKAQAMLYDVFGTSPVIVPDAIVEKVVVIGPPLVKRQEVRY
jgi:hypothetical protein